MEAMSERLGPPGPQAAFVTHPTDHACLEWAEWEPIQSYQTFAEELRVNTPERFTGSPEKSGAHAVMYPSNYTRLEWPVLERPSPAYSPLQTEWSSARRLVRALSDPGHRQPVSRVSGGMFLHGGVQDSGLLHSLRMRF